MGVLIRGYLRVPLNKGTTRVPLQGSIRVQGVYKNMGLPYFGVLIIRILLFRALYWGPLFSETRIFMPRRQ